MSSQKIHPLKIKRKIAQSRFWKYFKFNFFLLFFVAWSNILTCQTINLYAGSMDGITGYSGDGGPAISARLNYPGGTVSDKQGNLFIADGNNHVVRKISPSGIISTVAGIGTFGYSGDSGPASSAQLWFPTSLAFDTAGNLYILEYVTSVVRKVNKQGIISTIAGNGTRGYSGDGGPAILAQLNGPTDLAIDKAGNIYIADKENKVVRKVSTSGIISTVAGNGIGGYTGDGGAASGAQVSPDAVATDDKGNLYIADGQHSVIRKVNASGTISTFAGKGTYGYSGDGGLATLAQFAVGSPTDIAFDNAGNLFAADYENQVIRKVSPAGIISTVAGIAHQSGYSGDGGPALAAILWFPTRISLDSCNNFYITDSYNNRIRKVSSDESATVLEGPADISVCENSKATFGIRTDNRMNLQWMINTGSGWKILEDNQTYSGANKDTLLINTVTAPMNNYQYLCLVANNCGPVYSQTATLHVQSATLPAITITASDTSICKGRKVIFSASSSYAGTAVYQWKKNRADVGTNTISYSDTSLKNGDIITCTLTSSNSCIDRNAVLSNPIVITVDTVLIPSITITASEDLICNHTPAAFVASAVNAGKHPVFQWKKNGSDVGTNSLGFTSDELADHDVITCTLYPDDACTATSQVISNSVAISLKHDTTPKVSIVASSDTICAGTSVTFTATNESKSGSPSYQWLVDGEKVGSNSTVFITDSLTGNPVIQCVMTVPQCVGTTKDYSNPIPITVNSFLHPSVIITSLSPASICKGEPATFVATAAQAGSNPFYQWRINGNNVGTNSTHFTISSLNDGDILTCVLRTDSSLKCLQNSTITSNAITVNVKTPAHIPINIFPSANNLCGSKPVTFSAADQRGDIGSSYLWLLNGNKTGTDSIAYTNPAPANNDQVRLVVTTNIPGCSAFISDTSNTITVSIKPTPGIRLSPSDTVVMAGTQVSLQSFITGDIASFSWAPANGLISSQTLSPLTAPVESSTKYNLAVVAKNGCIAVAESNIKVMVKLYMPTSFTPNGDGKNDLFRIAPGTSIHLSELAIYNAWGTKIFSTSDINKGWDGTYKGSLQNAGVYIFTVNATDYGGQNIHVKGTVVLIR